MPAPESASTAANGHWVVERPDSDLARGKFGAPPWAIVLIAAAAVSVAVWLSVRRWRASR